MMEACGKAFSLPVERGDRKVVKATEAVQSLPLLMWCVDRGLKIGELKPEHAEKAAMTGRLDVLQYLHENGCPWDERTCWKAALGGHLDMLQYAHENGCPWDESTCYEAAKRGHLHVLMYAHENGCPWDEWTCETAAEGGRRDVLDCG